MWRVSLDDWAQAYGQSLHAYGFSPVWLRRWTVRLLQFLKIFPQYSHRSRRPGREQLRCTTGELTVCPTFELGQNCMSCESVGSCDDCELFLVCSVCVAPRPIIWVWTGLSELVVHFHSPLVGSGWSIPTNFMSLVCFAKPCSSCQVLKNWK